MSRGPRGRRIDSGVAVVTLDASGDGEVEVEFAEAGFVAAPFVAVVPDAADEAAGATVEASGVDVDGFTLVVEGSQLASQDVEVVWFACEKG